MCVARLNGVSVIRRFDQSLIVVVVVIIRCRCFITTRWAYTQVLCDRRRRRRRTVTGRCPSGPDDRREWGMTVEVGDQNSRRGWTWATN